MELEGKRALVTGAGATAGIGFEIARLLLAEGAEVVISGRRQERGEDAALALGDGARFALCDLNEVDAVRALASAAGPVDILVNNASIVPAGPTVEQDLDGFEEALAVNLRAPYLLVAELVPAMLAAGGGSIVNVTTMTAHFGVPGLSVYSATKAALESLTRTWAVEFGAGNVRVNALAPGPTRSEKSLEASAEDLEAFGRTTALGRSASITEIAEVALFLAGPRSSYLTGSVVHANAGRTVV